MISVAWCVERVKHSWKGFVGYFWSVLMCCLACRYHAPHGNIGRSFVGVVVWICLAQGVALLWALALLEFSGLKVSKASPFHQKISMKMSRWVRLLNTVTLYKRARRTNTLSSVSGSYLILLQRAMGGTVATWYFFSTSTTSMSSTFRTPSFSTELPLSWELLKVSSFWCSVLFSSTGQTVPFP